MFKQLFKNSDLTRKKVHLSNRDVSINELVPSLLVDYLASQNSGLNFRFSNVEASIQVSIVKRGFSNHPEAFTVNASLDSVSVTANSPVGAWRGLNCVINLINHSQLTQGVIHDWPSLDLRGFHLDLSFVMFSKEFLLELIPQLSTIGINTILLEISDKMIFTFMSGISHPDALDLNFWNEFETKANDFFIEIVPLVQTFGHMGNHLKHKPLAKLREKQDSSAVICPSRQSSLDFLEKLLIDVRQAFPRSRYIHVGLDEVGYTGDCEYCQQPYRELGYGGVFGKHISNLHSHLNKLNSGMMMWADMLIAYPEICQDISRDIIINDWQYTRYSSECRNWFVFTGMKTPGMQEGGLLANISRFPEDLYREYQPYLYSGNSSRPFKAFPYTTYFQDQGFQVISNPASKCVGSNLLVPDYRHRLPNVLVSAENSAQAGAMGMINTNWSCRVTHVFSNSWLGIFAGAVTSWTGVAPRNQLLNRLFCQWIIRTSSNPGIISLFRKLGTPLTVLSNLYTWTDGSEHFSSPIQAGIDQLKEQYARKTNRQKAQYLDKLTHLQSWIAGFPEIDGTNTNARTELDLTKTVFLQKTEEERQLVLSPSRYSGNSELKKSQVNLIFSKSLSKHSLEALNLLLNTG